MWRLLPFHHAMAECDITSRLFGIGKGVALRKLNSAPIYKQMAEVFCGQESCGDTVSTGERRLSLACMEHRLARSWMICVIDDSSRRYLQAIQLCNYTASLPTTWAVLGPPRLTTALACMCKCRSGWGERDDMDPYRRIGLATIA